VQTFADLGILESMAVRGKSVRVIPKGKRGVLWEETPVAPSHWYVAVWLLGRVTEHPTAPWGLHGSDRGLSRPQCPGTQSECGLSQG